MLKPEQVPDEVVKRFATWQFPKCTDKLMRSMLADAINAWPGMSDIPSDQADGDLYPRVIHLPLPQEAGDAEGA